MVITIYSTGCPTCGKDKRIINRARRLLSEAYHTVIVKNNKYDVQAYNEHVTALRDKLGIRDSTPTLLVTEHGRALLLANAKDGDIYGILS